MTRCRVCTTNDPDALREEIAAEMWSGRVSGVPWSDAGPYWRAKMLELADDALRAMMRDHALEPEPTRKPGVFRTSRQRD